MLARLAEYYGVFQFTPLREGRQQRERCLNHSQHFNSRPSARGDRVFCCGCLAGIISIHAPPRGATQIHRCTAVVHTISIHAPPRGATRSKVASAGAKKDFNSRPSARGDSSVHGLHKVHDNFNSRPSARGDRLRCPSRILPVLISIHAPPRGATQSACLPCLFSADFNSRPSARGDLLRVLVECPRLISIHAPPRGATKSPTSTIHDFPISIHAPPRGATPGRARGS